MSVSAAQFTSEIAQLALVWAAYANLNAELTAIATALGPDPTVHDATIETPSAPLKIGPPLSTFTSKANILVNKAKAGNLSNSAMVTAINSVLSGLGGGGPPPFTPAWARVQGVSTTTGGATSATITLPSAVTSGNIVVGAALIQLAAVSNITDDKGNSYQIINADGGGRNDSSNLQVTGFRSVAPITNGPRILTLTYTSSGLFWGIAEEFTAGPGMPGASLDGSQLIVNSNLVSLPAFQTLNSNDLLWCGAFPTTSVTTGSGWTAGLGSGTQQMSMWKTSGAPSASNVVTLGTLSGLMWTTAFAVAAVANTSWALRQNQMQRTNTGGTSGTIVFPKTIASGTLVVGTAAVNSAPGTNGNVSDITSIVDDKGNTYSMVPNYINNRGRVMFYGGPFTNGPKTITITTSVSENVIYALANEFALPPGKSSVAIDGAPTMVTSGGTTFTSGSVTTTIGGDLLYSEADVAGQAFTTNGFSVLNGSNMTWSDAYLIQGAAGPITANWTGSGTVGANTIGLVAFKAS